MAGSLNRRAFLQRAGAGAATAAVMGAPILSRSRPARAAAADRLVVAVGQWGTETPFAWRTVQSEKPLWDCIYDPLIQRDPKTFEYRPGLATEWKPSNDLKTWTFKLRPGVKFHEGWGELSAEDVKFTVEQNMKPDAGGGSSPFFRMQLDRIETPDKLTVVMHFKNRVWEVPSLFTQFVGYQNIVPKKYLETPGRRRPRSIRSAPVPIATSRGARAIFIASRRSRTTGGRPRTSRSWLFAGSPTRPHASPGCERARSTSASSSATTSIRPRSRGYACTMRRIPPATG